jgi:hypothetical protein
MPFGIILLILFLICHNFGGLERVNPFQPNPFQPPKNVVFFGVERVNPFQPPKIVAYEGENLKYDVTRHHWAGKG